MPHIDVADILKTQAAACGAMGSPLYAELLSRAADDYTAGGPVRRFFDQRPDRESLSRPGLRLMATLHHAALTGSAPAIAAAFPTCGGTGDAEAAWAACSEFLDEERARAGSFFERMPQTNEVMRSTLLLGGALAIAAAYDLPLDLFEVGTSAGLNLRFDRYSYAGAAWSWGTEERLRLECRDAGVPACLDATLRVSGRRGCDLHPVDVTSASQALALAAFVWADQPERLGRLRMATHLACETPATIEACDMNHWISKIEPRANAVTAVMHSVVTEHLAGPTLALFRESIHRLGRRAAPTRPVAWLRMEPAHDRYETRVTSWPRAAEVLIAKSDGHGNGITWTGASFDA